MTGGSQSFSNGASMMARGLVIMAVASSRAFNRFVRTYPYAALGIVLVLSVAFCAQTDIRNRTERDSINKKYTMLRLRYDSVLSMKQSTRVVHDTVTVFRTRPAVRVNRNDSLSSQKAIIS